MTFFKHWTRKGYALFNTLGKSIKICVLLTTVLGSFSQQVMAQNEAESETERETSKEYAEEEVLLNEVVVQTQRVPAVYSQQARVVNVITKDQIKQAPVQSIQELLEYVSGVDIQQRGPMGIQADISIRGGSFDQALVLLNGVNINNPQTGHLNLNLPVDIESVEAVEILQGPGSRVFGPSAFSGAINIITNKSKENNISLNAMGGDFGTYKVALSGTYNSGNMTHFVSVSNGASDGFARNTDYNTETYYYNGNLQTYIGDLDLQVGYGNKAFGASTFYSANFPDQFEENSSLYTSLKFTSNTKVKFSPLVYWNRSQDRFELFRDFNNAADWYVDHNYHMTDVYGTNLSAEYESKFGITAIGVDFRSENILSTVLGTDMDEPKEIPGEESLFTKSESRHNISTYFEHNLYLNKFTASLGVMANWSQKYEGDSYTFNTFPGVDLAYDLGKGYSVFGSVNTAMRLPTFTDMYYSGPTDLGNPDLEAEKSITFEGGFKFGKSSLNASISAFNRLGKNIIDWVQTEEGGQFVATNVQELDTKGFDLFVQYSPQMDFGKSMPIRKVTMTYTYLNVEANESEEEVSKYVLSNLRNKLVLGLDHQIFRNLYANWQINYQDRAYNTWSLEDQTENPFEPVWLIDARVYYQKDFYTFYVEASNLLDVDYVDFISVEQPGRWIKAGLKLDLNL
ncbi:TonB-dependent receptor plug domain-containing protein [Sediminitomix flava]|uniref:Iron complex outermembrane receptor protein n=1 Tax=Sediminitomix flava TaxID=379075 RepID=A0A315Z9D7_SEDFL|nr:TonB-dependent receptor [Sediminitomix flava]PWJ40166.1 iron complex outermembrane receptor protein [Sediminitomix flava]